MAGFYTAALSKSQALHWPGLSPPSTPATYQRRFAERDREVKLVVDHAVPISVIVASLFAGDVELTRESIGAYLNRWYRLGLLSHYEDASLNALGLRSAMPVAWDRVDPFARYEAAGIATAQVEEDAPG